MNILVVDDNRSNLLSLEDLILLSGNKATAVLTPVEALDLSDAEEFDLAFIDYALPKMNGIELIERLRAKHSETTYILISGCSSISLIEESKRAGASTFFRKPLQVEPILEYLELAQRAIDTRDLEAG